MYMECTIEQMCIGGGGQGVIYRKRGGVGEGGEAVGLSLRTNGGSGVGVRVSIGGDDSGGEGVGLCSVNEGDVLTASGDDEKGGEHWCY